MTEILLRARHECVCGAVTPLAPTVGEVLHDHSVTVQHELAAAQFHNEHEACRWAVAS